MCHKQNKIFIAPFDKLKAGFSVPKKSALSEVEGLLWARSLGRGNGEIKILTRLKKLRSSLEGKVSSWYYLSPTGVNLKYGQKIKITARGRVCWEGASRCGPDGHYCCDDLSYCSQARFFGKTCRCVGPEGSTKKWEEAWWLYARVGEDGADFKVGKEYEGHCLEVDGQMKWEIQLNNLFWILDEF